MPADQCSVRKSVESQTDRYMQLKPNLPLVHPVPAAAESQLAQNLDHIEAVGGYLIVEGWTTPTIMSRTSKRPDTVCFETIGQSQAVGFIIKRICTDPERVLLTGLQ
jgi:hypothetical protein